MKLIRLLFLIMLMMSLSGCVLTKIVTVPMRVGGAIISIVPVAGNTAHDAIDVAAENIDKIPM